MHTGSAAHGRCCVPLHAHPVLHGQPPSTGLQQAAHSRLEKAPLFSVATRLTCATGVSVLSLANGLGLRVVHVLTATEPSVAGLLFMSYSQRL